MFFWLGSGLKTEEAERDHSLLKWLGLVTAAPLVALSGIISLALCQAVISCCPQPASAVAAAAHTKSQYYPGEPLLQTSPRTALPAGYRVSGLLILITTPS